MRLEIALTCFAAPRAKNVSIGFVPDSAPTLTLHHYTHVRLVFQWRRAYQHQRRPWPMSSCIYLPNRDKGVPRSHTSMEFRDILDLQTE